MTDRRDFLKLSTVLAVGAMSGVGLPESAGAVEPVSRKGGPVIKVGCAAYSYRKYLKGDDSSMTLEGFLETAAEIGCDGVELTSYYFPPDAGVEYMNTLKRRAFLLGMDVAGTAVGNHFTLPPGPQRDRQIALVRKWINHAAEMGAPCVRIFAGQTPEGRTEEEAIRWVVECIEDCAELAAERGVMLALENHGGVTSTAEQVLRIMQEVKSEWVGLNLDTGNFRAADPYSDIAKAAPHAVTTHLKTTVRPSGGDKEGADLGKIMGILKDVGYRGYLTLEYEAAEDPKTAVPRYISELRKAVS